MRKILYKIAASVIFGLVLFFGMGFKTLEPAKLELLPIFGDNMVLQQGQKIPVWGIANSEATVTVKFANQNVSAKAGKDGKWKVILQPLNLGAPDSLIIECSGIKKVFKNVLVGEVWICSGQSNMEMNVACTWAKVKNSEEEVANANFPGIRLFTVERNMSVVPIDTIVSSGWKVCSPETVGGFSAAGYFFGKEIHKSKNVPVGLIQSAWGGTVAEAWTSGETLKLMEDFAGVVRKIEKMPANKDSLLKAYDLDYHSWLEETGKLDVGIKGKDTIFASPSLTENEWMEIQVPGYWEGTKMGAIDGVVWYRKKVTVPSDQIGKNFTISVLPPDDADETWVNGVKVGESAQWNVVRQYKVPANVIKAGENVVVVRLSDPQGNGGFMGNANDFSLYNDNGWNANLSGTWICKLGYNKINVKTKLLKPEDPNRPTVLYNAMINPIVGFAIKGAIWYQGESNSGMAYQYRELFPKMITDWRKKWNQGDFPFIFVQLANYNPRNAEPVEDAWAELREAQLMTLKLPNTGMAVTIDIGDGGNIHPANKQDVGKRLALAARKVAYKEDIPYCGPIYKSLKINGNAITLDFNCVFNGLSTSDSKKVTGFAIAGDDKKFYWADAKILGDKIRLSSPKVPKPKAVRYAWSGNPECNLINSAGLPASPFRTDNWPGLTVPDKLKNK